MKSQHLLGSTSTSGHAWQLALAAGGLGVLASDSVTPVVANTSMGANLLQSLNIATDGANKVVDNKLGSLAGNNVLLSVQEIVGNLELLGVVDDGNQLLNLFVGQSTSTAININFGLLADDVGESLAHTGDLGHGEHDLPLSLNIGVQHTKNVLKLR